jgi:PAS domain S-box-containing protein
MSQPAVHANKQEVAEAAVEGFRKQLGPFVVAAETTRMPIVFTNAEDVGNPIIFANDSFLSLVGHERHEVLGSPFNSLMERGSDPKSLSQIKAAFEGKSNIGTEIQFRRRNGGEFCASIFISPVNNQNGDVIQHFVSIFDTTDHKIEKIQSRMLIEELNHRVKNTLSTVQSLVAQALRSSPDPAVIGQLIESRLFALSRSHDLLTRESWRSAGLLDVVKTALDPFGVPDGQAERFVIAGEDIRFPPNAALALGIAFHELATNAAKYGALLNAAGCVHVSWVIENTAAGDRLILDWRESGGPPVAPPVRRGFGSRVIQQGLAHELDGDVRLKYPPSGVVCTINIPAPRATCGE